jgi:hypothetical protein
LTNSDSQQRLAEATLVALWDAVSATTGAPSDTVVFLPNMRALRWRDAISHLATLDKPLLCVSTLFDGWLCVGTWPTEAQSGVAEDFAAMVDASFDEVRGPAQPRAIDALVRFESGVTLELTRPELRQWIVEYRMPFVSMEVDVAAGADAEHSRVVCLVRRSTSGWMSTPDDDSGDRVSSQP